MAILIEMNDNNFQTPENEIPQCPGGELIGEQSKRTVNGHSPATKILIFVGVFLLLMLVIVNYLKLSE